MTKRTVTTEMSPVKVTVSNKTLSWTRLASWLPYIFIAFFLVIQLFPLIWVLSASLQTPETLAAGPSNRLIPESFYLGNYIRAFSTSPLLRYVFNSTVVAVLTIGITVVLAAPAAYAIEKLRFAGSQIVLSYFLLGLMIPVFVSLLPIFQSLSFMGLRNTYWAVVIPQVGYQLPVAIYLYASFYKGIPNEILESASMDGAGVFRAFLYVVVPLSINATVTIIVYNFIFVWNEFVFANTFLTTTAIKTLPVGLNDFVHEMGRRDYGATYAAIVVSVIPTVVLYLFLNRRVIDSMTAGSVRG
jgi:raffinose/stachyose/melibiose transport system permease protein